MLAFVPLPTASPSTEIGVTAGDISSDTQIRVIRLIKPEICTKMLNLWWKTRSKISLGYSLSRISRLDDTLSGIVLEGSPIEGQHVQPKDKKRRKRKRAKRALRHRSLSLLEV